jgi:Mg2+ and Co2+ transporter CorA
VLQNPNKTYVHFEMRRDSASLGTYANKRRFAPQDVPAPTTKDGLCELFDTHKIPSAFIAESLQGVSQSFSVQRDDKATCVFFHLLVKDVAISDGRIVHIKGPEHIASVDTQSQANFTWLKPGFVLKIRNEPRTPQPPNRSTSSSSESTLTSTATNPIVEMFCFGAPMTIRDRFQKLKDVATCEDLLLDPYILLEIVLSEMYKVMDQTGWAISDIFGRIEKASAMNVLSMLKLFLTLCQQTLEMATTPGRATKELLDFQGLHNLAKHNIYLRENCESALATLDDLRDHHKSSSGDRPTPAQEYTKQALKYQKTLFQSTQRRIASVDRRIENMIQLSFNIVTQGDSRLMQSESQSMKTIAIMTLFFMPLSTVAGIFGTEFMKTEDGPGHHITVSQDFWLLWLIAVPLTIVVLVIWRVWYTDAKGRLVGEIPREAERYMGWKTLRHTVLSP